MKLNTKHILFCAFVSFVSFTACDVTLSRDDMPYNDTSINGSLSSLVINENTLYAINNGSLVGYDISNPYNTISQSSAPLTKDNGMSIYNMETIFPYGNHLFIGATDGMHIVDVSRPSNPKYVSTYEHIVSCDPVVVNDSMAYVTLRGGNVCGQSQNILKVIDILDFSNPKEIDSYIMDSPYGLGIDGDMLFVCDNGRIKVMDCSDPYNVSLIETTDNILASDVIPFNNTLIVLSENSLSQYEYSLGSFNHLSTLSNQ